MRDALLGRPSGDYDLEVYGLSPERLRTVAASFGQVALVGRQFAVFKLDGGGVCVDLALPRRERSSGAGHRDFVVEPDPGMAPEQAVLRRDFTINAMMFDPLRGRLLDLCGGQEDLRRGVLRHVGSAFVEDPLRPLRAMQFCARCDMRLAPESAGLCRGMVAMASALPVARVAQEWRKWALADHPDAGLRALRASGWLDCYPELAALCDTPQDPVWHPEGDVWRHTVQVCAVAARVARREELTEEDRLVLLLAALCHDLGKPATTVADAEGRWRSRGHAEAGIAPTRAFLAAIGAARAVTARVMPLVREHLVHLHGGPTPRAVRRLADRLQPASLAMWEHLIEADASGRAPNPPGRPGLPWLRLAQEMAVQRTPPKPVVSGKWLLARGVAPGPRVGALLREAWQRQLDGEITDEESAQRWWRVRGEE